MHSMVFAGRGGDGLRRFTRVRKGLDGTPPMTNNPARLSTTRTTRTASSSLPSSPMTAAAAAARERAWWHISLFRGMVNDVRRRLPYYKSDWTDAWDYRIVPSTGCEGVNC
ncbi:hypothetical protein L873DRAFT_885211 [Choiromyces venosus 120613-1]|uniref:Uncharacterized protein n=1 Tax=Choiromyces venosus 120613-1 TaxID=1336337 RepID=A0A3N4K1N6_9PEZI|nr:hypothetical protein L873DRAFT_885211 [Choiromyces venosus 120613-1]